MGIDIQCGAQFQGMSGRDVEEAFLRSFVSRPARDRYLALLGRRGSKGRIKFLDTLNHKMARELDLAYVRKLKGTA